MKAKLSASLKGRKISEETRAKMSLAKKGHMVTHETRMKISETRRLKNNTS